MSSTLRTTRILVNGARGSRRRGPGTCTGCGRKLYWVATEAGKPTCFDVVPEVLELDGDVEVVSTEHSHWWTCPKSADFKRRDRGCRGSGGAADLAADVPSDRKDGQFDW